MALEEPGRPGLPPTSPANAPGTGSPSSPRFYCLRFGSVAAVCLLAGAFLYYNARPLWYSDVWAHMAFGRWIVQHWDLPDHDPVNPYTDRETDLVHYYWLGQASAYLLYDAGERLAGGDELRRLAGGGEMLLLAQAGLATLYIGLLLLAYRRAADSLPLACAGLALFLALSPSIVGVFRPQVIGMALFALVLATLSRKALLPRDWLILPLGFAVWANCHGSFLIGLYLMGLFLAGRVVEVGIERRTWNVLRTWEDRRVRHLTALVGLCVLATFLNPHGPLLHVAAVRLTRHPNIATLAEWRPLRFSLEMGWHWSYGLTLVVIGLSLIASRRRPTPTQLLLVLAFAPLPLLQMRHLVWWLPLVPWVVVPHWNTLGGVPWTWLRRESVPGPGKTLLAVLAVVAVAILSGPGQWLLRGHPRPPTEAFSPATPWRLAEQIRAAPADGQLPALAEALRHQYPDGRFNGTIFASETQGDYLVWALPPEYPVLMYTHAHLFPADHWGQCVEVKFGKPGWREICDRHRVNLIAVEAESHPVLREHLKQDADWLILLDETGEPTRPPQQRVLIALRRVPR